MEYLEIYLALGIWMFISMGFGMYEADLFHYDSGYSKNFKEKFKIDVHVFFTFLRALAATPIILFIFYFYDIIETVYTFLFMVFSFPFFHDGAYYQWRKLLSEGRVYPRGWFDRSRTTSAIFSIGFFLRVLLLIIALIFFLPY